jgi:hypothetical protein
LPVIVYTGKELTPEEQSRLDSLAESVIVKDASSPGRLLDETVLFLHRVEADLPDAKKRILRHVHDTDPVLAGRQILIVDDDLRNIYALTAVLERYEMKVLYAENGQDGIDVLTQTLPGSTPS